MKSSVSSQHHLVHAIGRVAMLTADQERDLARRIADGDREARDTLIERNIPLAIRIASLYARRRPDRFDDLTSFALSGLIVAADRFNPDRGRFSTCASQWIRHTITRGIPDEFHLIRVPAALYTRLCPGSKSEQPDPHLANAALRAMRANTSGSDVLAEVEESRTRDDPAPLAALSDRVQLAISCLTPYEAEVIRLRYLEPGERPTLVQVAERIGVNAQTVRYHEQRAFASLRMLLDPAKKGAVKC